jgi:hypothetical protein
MPGTHKTFQLTIFASLLFVLIAQTGSSKNATERYDQLIRNSKK